MTRKVYSSLHIGTCNIVIFSKLLNSFLTSGFTKSYFTTYDFCTCEKIDNNSFDSIVRYKEFLKKITEAPL